MDRSLTTAAALGAVTGLRSMSGLAWTARQLASRRRPRRRWTRLERWLARDTVATTLAVCAAGELLVDKLPGVPGRITPGPLLGRAAIGGTLGALAGGEEARALGAAIGSGAAVAAAFAGWVLRTRVGGVGLSGITLALVEDAVALRGARAASAELAR